MSLCSRCGLFERLPALIVCGSCFEVSSSAFWDGLKDPDAPLPCCSVCNREETPEPDAESTDAPEADADTSKEDKPKRTRSRSKKSTDDAPEAASGDDGADQEVDEKPKRLHEPRLFCTPDENGKMKCVHSLVAAAQ